MRDIFTTKWFIGTIAAWVLIIALDEVAYYWWKSKNPGSTYSGIIVKQPVQNWTTDGLDNSNVTR